MRIILLGSSELSHLAAEINESSSEEDLVESSATLSRLEVVNVEVELSADEEARLTSKGVHGCIAVFSNRATFDFCSKWLHQAVIGDESSFRHLPVSLLLAADEALDERQVEQLVADGKRLMADLKAADSSTGSFFTPEGGVYLDMRPIQQVNILTSFRVRYF